ncbi:MAG TPA: cytochrome b [Trinickia sp.]|uniref:cytochrome b n=1 Tax=Trinickia sp. TaxID=2571163 RepID=UPI002BCD4055|nr:cytochrome b [Trinickia sp.]HTI16559.1 cytochrome b [Trinickia sp.]
MKSVRTHFSPVQRVLHWAMAALLFVMLFIGVVMVFTVSHLHSVLLVIHRPLGIALLLLVVIRFIVRMAHGSPPLPNDVPTLQHVAAKLTQVAMYVMMAAMPLIGWSMLSAGGYPVVLFGAVHLLPIAPRDPVLFSSLRTLHTWLAFALFATVLLHLAAALFHGLIRRDGVLSSMTGWASRRG